MKQTLFILACALLMLSSCRSEFIEEEFTINKVEKTTISPIAESNYEKQPVIIPPKK